jgi:hypothetical protein
MEKRQVFKPGVLILCGRKRTRTRDPNPWYGSQAFIHVPLPDK